MPRGACYTSLVAPFQIGAKPPAGYDDPAGMLTQCHRKIEQRLAALPRIAAALRAGDPAAPPALAETLDHFDHAGARHTEDEEYSVFPRLAGDDTRRLLDALSAEHRAHEAIYLAFRTVAKKLIETAPSEALVTELETHAAALTSAYRDHIAAEEKDLIPRLAALPPAELRAIGLEMRLRRGG